MKDWMIQTVLYVSVLTLIAISFLVIEKYHSSWHIGIINSSIDKWHFNNEDRPNCFCSCVEDEKNER